MYKEQILGNYGIDNNCSDINTHTHVKSLIHREHVDINSSPTRSFLCPRRRPIAYTTRDFPERCCAIGSQICVEGSEGFPNVVTAEHSSDGANSVADTQTKTLTSTKSKPIISLASCSRNYDMEHKINAHHLNEELPPLERAASPSGLKKRKHHSFVNPVDRCKNVVVCIKEEPKYNLKANELANVSAIQHDVSVAAKNKVKETLNLFKELHNGLLEEYKVERKGEGTGAGKRRFDVKAAESLKKKGKWIHLVKHFGHIPGIAIGDQFHFRAELVVVGLHCQYFSGIDYVVLNGKMFATSIVNSGRYENIAKTVDVLIYSGQGGHVGCVNKADQKLKHGNLALVNNMKKGYPVRVIKKGKSLKACNTLVGNDKWGLSYSYTYDGLYIVNKFWLERDRRGKLVFKFELHKISAQQSVGEYGKWTRKECCVVDDVSHGKENKAIRAMNGIDGKKPQAFAYATNMIYPEWCKQIPCRGCNCTTGCSNSEQCLCVLKNGGEIPFNEKGALLRPRDIVYECGPSCKCPTSCMNRVSQRGLRYKLELYKIESRGWGVRSPGYISMGNFVCEYVGKLQQIKEAKEKVEDDGGRFSGCIIDATKWGNVARFISYNSSSANLIIQRILYDHEDDRAPHIMLFAAKNICPLQELSCDYNKHGMDKVCGFQYQLKQ